MKNATKVADSPFLLFTKVLQEILKILSNLTKIFFSCCFFTRITVQVNSDLFLPLKVKSRFDEIPASRVFKLGKFSSQGERKIWKTC